MTSNIFVENDKLQTRINELKPLSEQQITELRRYFNIGLAYNSNALEGNTLTESETKAVIEDGLTVGGKPLKHHLEAIGHNKAFNHIFTLTKNAGITEEDIKKLHFLFYSGIDAENAGVYRKIRVFISGSEHKLPAPEKLPELMKKFAEKYSNFKQNEHPIQTAAQIHKDFVFIHPFIDGNGRIARLLMNLVLINAGFPITIIPPILRSEYMNSLEKAHKDDKTFIEFISKSVKQAQLEYLRLLE